MHVQELECHVRRLDCYPVIFKVNVKGRIQICSECTFTSHLLNLWSLSYQTWYIGIYRQAKWHAKGLHCYLQGQGHREGSECQWVCVYPVFHNHRALCYQTWYVGISSQNWRKGMQKDLVILKVKVVGCDYTQITSTAYLLHCWTIPSKFRNWWVELNRVACMSCYQGL